MKNDAGTVYYEVYRPEEAPAVLFSHGVAMDHRTFETQVQALEDRYRVIVWDMPYHGRSSPIDKKLRFSTTATDFVIALLDELNIRQAVLAGLSLGSLERSKRRTIIQTGSRLSFTSAAAHCIPNFPRFSKR